MSVPRFWGSLSRLCTLISVYSLISCVSALYSKADGVVALTPANFNNIVLEREGVTVVEFYAPWCGHCKSLAPHYKTVAQKLRGIVTFGAVDCDEASNKNLCAQYNIKGFPTVKIFGPDRIKDVNSGNLVKESTDFPAAGPLTAKALMDHASAKLHNLHVTRVASLADFDAFTSDKSEIPKVVLFTAKLETTTLFKGLSMQLHLGLDFAEVHESALDVIEMYGITDFPTLIVTKGDGATDIYTGELKAPLVYEYLLGFSVAPPPSSSSSTTKDDEDEGESGGRKSKGGDAGKGGAEKKEDRFKGQEVKTLTLDEAFALDAKEEAWLLALMYPNPSPSPPSTNPHDDVARSGTEEEGGGGHSSSPSTSSCPDSEAGFKKTIQEMQDVVKAALVIVNHDEVDKVKKHYGLSPAKLTAEPCALHLVLLPYGEDKDSVGDYLLYKGGNLSDGKALQKWVTQDLPLLTQEVEGQDYRRFLTSPPEGEEPDYKKPLLKMLLFTDKEEVPGVYKALALNHKDQGLSFGWIKSSRPANREVIKEFKISKIPSLILLRLVPNGPPSKEDGKEGSYGVQPLPYNGPIKYNAMAAWVKSVVTALGPKSKESDAEAAARLVPQVTDDASLNEHCFGKGGICVLGLLSSSPGATSSSSSSSPRDEKIIKALGSVALGKEGQPFSFTWIDAGKFRSVASAFGVSRASDLPSVVALSSKKMRYALLPLASSASSDLAGEVGTFIDGVLSGKIRTDLLQEAPKVSAATDAASGEKGEGKVPEEEEVVLEEEEFDLSDIMSEEVEDSGVVGDRMKRAEELLKAEEEEEAARKEKAGSKKKKSSKKGKKGKSSSKKGKEEL